MKYLLTIILSVMAMSGFADPFLPPRSPQLEERSIEVTEEEFLNGTAESIVQTMMDVAQIETKDHSRHYMVGLAAIQIGIPKRIILVDINCCREKPDNETIMKVMINPVIIQTSDETKEGFEGCYSVEKRYVGRVKRYQTVTVKAQDINGQYFTLTLENVPAAVVQHEIDHLNGFVFPQKAKAIFVVEEDQYAGFKENWRNWPNTITAEDLSYEKIN